MKFLSNITNKTYSYTAIKRTLVVGLSLGILTASVCIVMVVPKIESGWQSITDKFTEDIVYERPEQVVIEQKPEKIELYYQDELNKLKEKYETLHSNEARNRAIERVKKDLEKEQEELRKQELFL